MGVFTVAFAAEDPLFDEFVEWDGRELAQAYCIACHTFPEPDQLPKKSWPYLLDLMGLYFGYDDGDLLAAAKERGTAADQYDVTKYPARPSLNPFQWAAIRDYYESAKGAAPVPPPPPGAALESFSVEFVEGDSPVPVVSLVKVSPSGGFYLGDAVGNRLLRFSGTVDPVGQSPLPGTIVQLEIDAEVERATIIGWMHPSNNPTGSLVRRKRGEDAWEVIAEPLHRPVNAISADLDGDHQDEWMVNEFGHYSVGGLTLFDQGDDGLWTARHLRSEPGSISGVIFPDGDGLPHAIVLNAQAREDVTLYRNLGGLRFEPELLLQHPPGWGSTQLHRVDLTGDGKDELVIVNGDNADLPGPPLKGYHGIRVYRIDEGPELSEVAFLRMPGAFQATFNDFDGDGRTDIAAVSYFPDHRAPEQRFVLFANRGGLQFDRGIVAAAANDPWMTIGSGDIDGDGDADIILGRGFERNAAPPGDGSSLPAAMILRNRTAD